MRYLLAIFLLSLSLMAQVVLSPVAKQQFLDVSGHPLAGGMLYTYSAGTTTPLSTYTDSTGVTPNTNPIVLNSGGFTPQELWLTSSASYKFVLTDMNGVQQWTADNVSTPAGTTLNLSSPPPIGNTTPNTIAGTTITATTGFTGPIGSTTPNTGVFSKLNGVIVVDGSTNANISTAMARCTGPCIVDSRGHSETIGGTITFPGFPVTLLLGPYTYTGPASGPAFLINSYLSNGSQIIGSGMTSANQSNQGNGTTIKANASNTSDLVQLLNGSGQTIQGFVISDLTLDGNSSAVNLLDLDAVRHSYFLRLNFQNCGTSGKMIYSYVTASAANQGTQFNVFDQITGANCAQALYADGNAAASSDFTQNLLSNWSVIFSSATVPGIQFHQADGNQLQNIKVFPSAGSYANCLQFDSPAAGVLGGLENRVFGLHIGCLTTNHTIYAQSGTYGNRIYGYDQIENQAAPQDSGNLFWEGVTASGFDSWEFPSNASLKINYDAILSRCAAAQWSLDASATCDHNGSMLGYFYSNAFSSLTANPAAAGNIRLAKTDYIAFRNATNSADIPLGTGGGNSLAWNSQPFVDSSGNVLAGNGSNIVYRCATAGATLPVGSLTINAAACGTTTDTGLRVK